MNRTKKFFKNAVSTAFFQIVNMLVSFFIPRIMLVIYGSEINGLVSSITQFIVYFNLLEAGLSGAAVWALYEPLAKKNVRSINSIIVAVKNLYNWVGYVFISLVLGLAFIYPFFIRVTTLSTIEVSFLVLTIGASGALEFFTLSKYRVLLTADQKTYVISLASSITVILNAMLIALLASFNINIVITMAVASTTIFFRSFILWFYVRKNYQYIDYSEFPDESKLNKRWYALYLQILGVIHTGGPIVLATMFTDLKMVSVYTVFNLVTKGVGAVLGIFVSGLAASFGDVIAKKEQDTLKRTYDEFELSYYTLISIIYSVTFIMLMPFIRLYTKNITDISYELPVFGFLMVLNGLLFNVKTPQGMLVISAGLYRETRWQTTMQGSILLGVGIIGGYYYGLVGIVLASIISNIYRDIDLAIYIPKVLLNINPKRTFKRILISFIMIFIICSPFYFIKLPIVDFYDWSSYALLLLVYSSVIVMSFMLFLEKATLLRIFNRLKNMSNR